MTSLEVALRSIRDNATKALVPYFVAGVSDDWTDYVSAAVHGGADAIEIGIPFSDPMMDGVVIQEAGLQALQRGTTLESIGRDVEALDVAVPLVAMTYYNIFLHYGLDRAAGRLHEFGLSGAIVPDLSLEESTDWSEACEKNDVATIFLVAPSTPKERLGEVARRSEGFVYAAARMAVTGASSDEGDAERVVGELRAMSDVPVYVGIGITTPVQAARTAVFADGVIVGSALVKAVLDGASPTEIEVMVRTFRDAIDRGES